MNFSIKNRGVTLIEVLITLIIIAIVILVAAPHMTNMLASMEAKKVESNMRTLISQTKYHAYIYQERLAICGSLDGETCNSAGWSSEILVFKDSHIKNRLREPQEEIVQRVVLNLKYGHFSWAGARGQNLVFQSDSGLPRGSNGTFKYCNATLPYSFYLIMSDMGNLRTESKSSC